MNSKKVVILVVLAGMLLFSLPLAAKKKKPAEPPKPVYIAPQVAAVFDADVALRKNRNDIPMAYLRTLLLPAQQNQLYPAFIFQIKNADLNFAATAELPELLKTKFHAFVRIYRLDQGNVPVGQIVKERYIPFDLEEAKATFVPEAANYYSIAGDIFPAGNYLLALGISTLDFSKISACYQEFTLPDFSQLKGKLDTTPIFSVRSLQQLPAPDTKVIIHKNSFIYSTLLLDPNLSNEFKAGENLDLFYFVIGAAADPQTSAYNIQVTYRFKKDGKEIVKLSPISLNSMVVSQPIPFSFTEVTRDAKGNEKGRSEKKLEPGEYVLGIELLDNVSKATGLKEFTFKIV